MSQNINVLISSYWAKISLFPSVSVKSVSSNLQTGSGVQEQALPPRDYKLGQKSRKILCEWVCALHLTHPSAHTHREHTPGAVGSHLCCCAWGVGGSVPCSRVSPQSWYWGWRERWTFTEHTYNPCRTWDSNPRLSGYRSNALSIRPQLPPLVNTAPLLISHGMVVPKTSRKNLMEIVKQTLLSGPTKVLYGIFYLPIGKEDPCIKYLLRWF